MNTASNEKQSAATPGGNLFEPLLDNTQAAEAIGIEPETLEVWRSTGRVRIPYFKIGRSVKYRPSDLAAFLAKNLKAGWTKRELLTG